MTGITEITRIARINEMTGLQGLYPFWNKKLKQFFFESVFFSSSTT